MSAVDDGNYILLELLDLSFAAFDFVYQWDFNKSFQLFFGIQSTVLHWLTSYFIEWTQCLHLHENVSFIETVCYGGPQGLLLGLLLLILYTADINNTVK